MTVFNATAVGRFVYSYFPAKVQNRRRYVPSGCGTYLPHGPADGSWPRYRILQGPEIRRSEMGWHCPRAIPTRMFTMARHIEKDPESHGYFSLPGDTTL